MVGRGELTDAARAQIAPPLSVTRRRGKQWADNRRVINGILWRVRTGAPWRDLPERYGPRRHWMGLEYETYAFRPPEPAVGCWSPVVYPEASLGVVRCIHRAARRAQEHRRPAGDAKRLPALEVGRSRAAGTCEGNPGILHLGR
jgi:Putative transposase of IS4/5 family (DUF4096)